MPATVMPDRPPSMHPAGMPNNHTSPSSLVSGHLPRLVDGERNVLDLADVDHAVETLGPLFQLAPWEIRRCLEQLARKNPHPLLPAQEHARQPETRSGASRRTWHT